MPNDGSGRSDGDHKMVDCIKPAAGSLAIQAPLAARNLKFVVKQRVGRADEVIE